MSLKKIYNIEALRRKIGCKTYKELETLYGYDVSGYFRIKELEADIKFFRDMNFSDPTRSDYLGT